MASKAFEAALKAPDTNSSNAQLYKLVAAADYSGSTLPHVAEECLRAFCDPTHSHTRRRWAGLAFAGMLNASPEVVKHVTTVKQKLQGLGEVIIGTDEREETKIIAGIVIRQALAQRFEFASFWSSDKVRNSAPTFPVEFDQGWMIKFQTFMDTLGDLALANPVTDPCILYAVSLEGSGDFRWVHARGGMLVSIIQADALTVILPDDLSHTVQFLDIPVSHIQVTNAQASAPLANSQARSTKHEPWDLVITLKNRAWTHLVNSAKCKVSKLTILFGKAEEARECEAALKELQEARAGSNESSQQPRMMSRSSQFGSSLSPSQNKHQSASRSQLEASLGHHPTTTMQHNQIVRREGTADKPSSPDASRLAARRGNDVPESKQDGAEAPREKLHARTTRAHGHAQSTNKVTGSDQPAQAQTQTTKSQDESHASSCASRGSRTVRQGPGNLQKSLENSDRVLSSAYSTRASSRHITCSKGKLPKVSQATKKRACQQLRDQSDVFKMPKESKRKSEARKEVGRGSGRGTQSKNRTTKSTVATNIEPASQTRQTGSKRKADTNDHFVPTHPTAIEGDTKRKNSIEATEPTERSSKKPRVEAKVSTQGVSRDEGGLSDHHELQNVEANEQVKVRRLQKSSRPQEPPSPSILTRTPLIGGLLGVQKPSHSPKAAFKKPSLPTRLPLPPSTPSQRRSQPPPSTMRPWTPNGIDMPQDAAMSVVPSSPPSINMAEEDLSRVRHGIVETEILSSNSKPVPASPHAESMAISGHANRDDIDLRKLESDIQTARLNPFAQTRDSHKTTSFMRRLTGDDLAVGEADPVEGSSQQLPIEMDESAHSDEEELVLKAASQPLVRTQATNGGKSSSTARAVLSQPCGRIMDHCKIHAGIKVEGTASSSAKQTTRREERVALTSNSLKHRKIPAVDEGAGQKSKDPAILFSPPENAAVSTNEEAKPLSKHEPTVEIVHFGIMASQEAVQDTPIANVVEPQNDWVAVDELTLLNDDSEELLLNMKASQLRFRSTLPLPGSPSSHSSTSAERPESPRPPIPTSEAEETEWEASLQPHQRELHNLLIRVSNRVVRHIVDNETAVTDIAEGFASDSQHLLQGVLRRHNAAYAEARADIDTKRIAMRKQLEKSIKALAKERARVSAVA